MPYIESDRRKFLTSKTYQELLDISDQMTAGDMNFLLSTLLWYRFAKGVSYSTGNAIVGILECAKLEFYRKLLAQYEDQKIQENGPLIFQVNEKPIEPLKQV
jgi:hypothetical protein